MQNTPGTPRSRAQSTQHVLRQAKMSRELEELNRILKTKEELAQKMTRSESEINSIREQYEVKICDRFLCFIPSKEKLTCVSDCLINLKVYIYK